MCTTSSYRRLILVPRSQTRYSFSCRNRILHRLVRLTTMICRISRIGEKTAEAEAYTRAANFMNKSLRPTSLRSTPLVSYRPCGRDLRRYVCRGRGGAQV
jgi:hypothetical protein